MTYKTAVVTFLDILGFRKIVATQNQEEIASILDAIAETAATPVGLGSEQTEVLSFSDSVIRVRATQPSMSFEDLLHEVQDLAVAQWSLLELGILVRGGTTIGKVATGPGRAYGPAFVRAYDLESSLAGAPRIVIDPAVVENVRQHVKGLPNRQAKREAIDSFKQNIRLGEDGLWYVDYLSSVSHFMQDKTYVHNSLFRFKNIIIEKANREGSTSAVLPKYLWLIRYHNLTVKKLEPKNNNLKIKSSDVPASDELLRPLLLAPSKQQRAHK